VVVLLLLVVLVVVAVEEAVLGARWPRRVRSPRRTANAVLPTTTTE